MTVPPAVPSPRPDPTPVPSPEEAEDARQQALARDRLRRLRQHTEADT